jgi:cation transport ATPase
MLPLLATVTLFAIGYKYIIAVGKYIRYGVANMDTLVGIGTGVAYVYSYLASSMYDIYPTIFGGAVFWEAVIVVI